MEKNGNSLELAESRDAIDLVPTWDPQLWWVFAGIAVFAAIFIFVVLLLRRKPVVDASKEKREAYLEAKAALSGDESTVPGESAIHVSMILRRYLARSMNDPALFETHEEFIARHDGLKDLPNDVRSAAEAFFSKLAADKYVPDDHVSIESNTTHAEGAALLERIHSA
jgi:hypothetical protein